MEVNEYSIKVGEMKVENKKIKANPDKGELIFYLNEEDLLSVRWRNITKNEFSQPITIFAEEWEWKEIKSIKGRVFALQCKDSPKLRHFYWMQEAIPDKDDVILDNINQILTTGLLIIGNPEDEEQFQFEGGCECEGDEGEGEEGEGDEDEDDEEYHPSNNVDYGKTNEIIQQTLRNVFSSISTQNKPKPEAEVNLDKILTIKNIEALLDSLNEEEIKKLLLLLPETQQKDKNDLLSNATSPQMYSAIDMLKQALHSENLTIILHSFGIQFNPTTVNKDPPTNTLINGILKSFPKKK